ncbi:MAG TPA: PspA/IM30 family protein [Bryobacteraceae bacterium]|jgi:phage shock protein A|nr:PspA/IM30 family protein [Bryobacteraceae bacterium]
MALLDRVTTLMKANVNDLIDKAENPEKLLKQLLLDMQNQFMQVKTQLAISIADQHLLQKRQHESLEAQQEWVRKAELALQKKQDDLARTALERSVTAETAAHNFSQQIEDQSHQVQTLKEALHRLEQKMTETQAKSELLMAQHRRARVAIRSSGGAIAGVEHDTTLNRMKVKVAEAEALGHGNTVAFEPGAEERFAALEKDDKVDRLLAELKSRAAVG